MKYGAQPSEKISNPLNGSGIWWAKHLVCHRGIAWQSWLAVAAKDYFQAREELSLIVGFAVDPISKSFPRKEHHAAKGA